MGIKGLWTVLTPYSEKKSLHEIRGETLAVDLSGWVCDSQNVTDYYVQPKLYLRNLFFRTIYLVLADVTPIFVLEGDAPELKRDVMAARNANQFRGAAPQSGTGPKSQPDVGRKRFRNVLRECENLLKCLGVQCIKGQGEAEATCAELNAQGFVDAVVSQDSDCFAYGARRVYRNFSVSSSAGGGAMQGSVDCYDADSLYQSNGFGRNKMVALALLCGCDYGVGACGSSISTAVAFLHTVSDSEIISRLVSWVSEPEYYSERSRWASAAGRCGRCGHGGRAHARSGCPDCGSHRGCNDTGYKTKLAEVKRELSLRARALSCGVPFPEPKIMKEFIKRSPEKIDIRSLKKPTPSLIQFVKFMTSKLDWSEKYCVEKFLPLLTKWHLQEHMPCKTIKPIAIKKKRNPRGVPSYEVLWADIDGQYDDLIPDDQFDEGEDPAAVWTSTERQDLMRQFYPELVESYEESVKKPPKEKKSKARKMKDDNNSDKPKRKYTKKIKNILQHVNESLKTMGLKTTELNSSKLNVSVNVNSLKRKIKSNSKKGPQKTLDSFVANKRRKSTRKAVESLRKSFKNMSLINESYDYIYSDALFDQKENVVESKHLLSMLNNIEDNAHESDLSGIIDSIVSRPLASGITTVDNNLVRLVFNKTTPKRSFNRKSILSEIRNNCSTPNESPVKKKKFSLNSDGNNCYNSPISKVNTSYFFDKLTDAGDAFEMSLEHKSAVINLDCDTTLDYSLPDICL